MNKRLAASIAAMAVGLPLIAADGVGTTASASDGVPTAAHTGNWGKAERLPGTGPGADLLSVSCTAVGYCGGGGSGFVDSETKGVWAKAESVPGAAGEDIMWFVSCVSPGTCAAAGTYSGTVYVDIQTKGVWGKTREAPGLAALNRGDDASIASVSCGARGDCATGGSYVDASHHTQAFVLTSMDGVWAKAREVPGLGALNRGGFAALSDVSCAGAGSCSAGGLYTDASHRQQGLVVNEVKGVWRTAEGVPGLKALNKGGYGQLNSVSCTSPGNCGGGGIYSDGGYNAVPFVVNEKHGVWDSARLVAGVNGFSAGAGAGIDQISCSSAGNCAAGGFYTDSGSTQQAFVVSQINGKWGTGEEVPGTSVLNTGNSALVVAVSCVGTGDCTAGGVLTLASGRLVVFVVAESKATWGHTLEIGDLGNDETLYSLSCVSTGNCEAGGGVYAVAGDAFVASETSSKPGS
ncbi:MAG: hypothetical protein ACLPQS_14715 [Acidimicrobiales bacterium]